jgi:hypothetical protein
LGISFGSGEYRIGILGILIAVMVQILVQI